MQRKVLIVEYDVTALSPDEVSDLEMEASVQAESSEPDEEFGKAGHPNVPVIGSRVEEREVPSRTVLLSVSVTVPGGNDAPVEAIASFVNDVISVGHEGYDAMVKEHEGSDDGMTGLEISVSDHGIELHP